MDTGQILTGAFRASGAKVIGVVGGRCVWVLDADFMSEGNLIGPKGLKFLLKALILLLDELKFLIYSTNLACKLREQVVQ